jgi:hypothetical protein
VTSVVSQARWHPDIEICRAKIKDRKTVISTLDVAVFSFQASYAKLFGWIPAKTFMF